MIVICVVAFVALLLSKFWQLLLALGAEIPRGTASKLQFFAAGPPGVAFSLGEIRAERLRFANPPSAESHVSVCPARRLRQG